MKNLYISYFPQPGPNTVCFKKQIGETNKLSLISGQFMYQGVRYLENFSNYAVLGSVTNFCNPHWQTLQYKESAYCLYIYDTQDLKRGSPLFNWGNWRT